VVVEDRAFEADRAERMAAAEFDVGGPLGLQVVMGLCGALLAA
jgi:hypothetical protein